MKWLIILLFLFTTINAEEITTNNLLDKNFDSGSWSGTADGRHGSNVIASEHNTYIQSDDISLKNDANLTELQIQNGYTTNHEFEYWHWNTYDSSVKSTVTITGANGETTTQIRNYNSSSCGSFNCGDYVTGSDTYTVLSSLQTDYDLSVRYDFTDSSNATENHYGVDLREPSLTVTYESDPFVLNEDIRDEIRELLEEFKPEKDLWVNEKVEFVKIKEEPVYMNEPRENFEVMTMQEPKFKEEFFKEKIVMEIKEEVVDNNETFVSMFDNTPEEDIIEEKNELISSFLPPPKDEPEIKREEMVKEEPPKEREEIVEDEPKEMASAPTEEREEIIEEESSTEKEPKSMAQPDNDEKKEIKEKKPTSKTAKKSTVQSKKLAKQKVIQQKKTIRDNLVKVMDKVDRDIKDISKNLQIKNIIKLDAMTSDQVSLDSYDVPFYKSKDIYLNQIQIQDMRQLYTDMSLNNYIANDPVVIMENKLRDIESRKQLLIMQLEQLKNG